MKPLRTCINARGSDRPPRVYTSSMISPSLPWNEFAFGQMDICERSLLVGSIEEASRLACEVFVEIGVCRADTSAGIAQVLKALKLKSKLISIDCNPESERAFKQKVKPSELVEAKFVCGKSWEVGNSFQGYCAWCLVDGCHCFDCCRADIESWAPKVAPGGLILFHDSDWRVQSRPKTQNATHEAKGIGVYDAVMTSELLMKDFYIVQAVEGAIDRKNLYWEGMMVWRKK